MRTGRSLIKVINELDKEVLMTVSPRSRNLHRFIKVPLLYFELICGIWSSISAISLKLTGEMIQSGEFMTYWYTTIVLMVLFVATLFVYTTASNLAMKFYE